MSSHAVVCVVSVWLYECINETWVPFVVACGRVIGVGVVVSVLAGCRCVVAAALTRHPMWAEALKSVGPLLVVRWSRVGGVGGE